MTTVGTSRTEEFLIELPFQQTPNMYRELIPFCFSCLEQYKIQFGENLFNLFSTFYSSKKKGISQEIDVILSIEMKEFSCSQTQLQIFIQSDTPEIYEYFRYFIAEKQSRAMISSLFPKEKKYRFSNIDCPIYLSLDEEKKVLFNKIARFVLSVESKFWLLWVESSPQRQKFVRLDIIMSDGVSEERASELMKSLRNDPTTFCSRICDYVQNEDTFLRDVFSTNLGMMFEGFNEQFTQKMHKKFKDPTIVKFSYFMKTIGDHCSESHQRRTDRLLSEMSASGGGASAGKARAGGGGGGGGASAGGSKRRNRSFRSERRSKSQKEQPPKTQISPPLPIVSQKSQNRQKQIEKQWNQVIALIPEGFKGAFTQKFKSDVHDWSLHDIKRIRSILDVIHRNRKYQKLSEEQLLQLINRASKSQSSASQIISEFTLQRKPSLQLAPQQSNRKRSFFNEWKGADGVQSDDDPFFQQEEHLKEKERNYRSLLRVCRFLYPETDVSRDLYLFVYRRCPPSDLRHITSAIDSLLHVPWFRFPKDWTTFLRTYLTIPRTRALSDPTTWRQKLQATSELYQYLPPAWRNPRELISKVRG